MNKVRTGRNETEQMKLNKNVAAAIKSKNKPTAKGAKTPQVKETLANIIAKARISQAVMVLTGVRGKNVRLVEVHETKDGRQFVKALQSNTGLLLKEGHFAEVVKGVLEGKRDALIELGGYVNGKLKGAKAELLTKGEWHSRSVPALVKWAADKDPVHGRYVGDPAQRGLVAVEAGGHYWQIEQDANSHNKHERGEVLPLKKEKLVAVK